MKEIWKVIAGYENYEVSNLGNVRSLNYNHTGKIKKMRFNHNKEGYVIVGLCTKGKRKNFSVHRLAAQAFIPNSFKKPQVNHIDECKTNNCIDNLEWVTAKENANHGTHNARISAARKNSTLSIETRVRMSIAHKKRLSNNDNLEGAG